MSRRRTQPSKATAPLPVEASDKDDMFLESKDKKSTKTEPKHKIAILQPRSNLGKKTVSSGDVTEPDESDNESEGQGSGSDSDTETKTNKTRTRKAAVPSQPAISTVTSVAASTVATTPTAVKPSADKKQQTSSSIAMPVAPQVAAATESKLTSALEYAPALAVLSSRQNEFQHDLALPTHTLVRRSPPPREMPEIPKSQMERKQSGLRVSNVAKCRERLGMHIGVLGSAFYRCFAFCVAKMTRENKTDDAAATDESDEESDGGGGDDNDTKQGESNNDQDGSDDDGERNSDDNSDADDDNQENSRASSASELSAETSESDTRSSRKRVRTGPMLQTRKPTSTRLGFAVIAALIIGFCIKFWSESMDQSRADADIHATRMRDLSINMNCSEYFSMLDNKFRVPHHRSSFFDIVGPPKVAYLHANHTMCIGWNGIKIRTKGGLHVDSNSTTFDLPYSQDGYWMTVSAADRTALRRFVCYRASYHAVSLARMIENDLWSARTYFKSIPLCKDSGPEESSSLRFINRDIMALLFGRLDYEPSA